MYDQIEMKEIVMRNRRRENFLKTGLSALRLYCFRNMFGLAGSNYQELGFSKSEPFFLE
jgi:hypothetical protein